MIGNPTAATAKSDQVQRVAGLAISITVPECNVRAARLRLPKKAGSATTAAPHFRCVAVNAPTAMSRVPGFAPIAEHAWVAMV